MTHTICRMVKLDYSLISVGLSTYLWLDGQEYIIEISGWDYDFVPESLIFPL